MSMGRNRAFTLAELLVSIGVIALLLAILIPSLRGARDSALELSVLNHQRGVAVVLDDYLRSHRGEFPTWGYPQTRRAPALEVDGEPVSPGGWWDQPRYWHVYLTLNGYDASAAAQGPEMTWDRPATREALDNLTHTAYANPSYWIHDGPQPVSDYLSQKWHTIEHPSRKGILARFDVRQDVMDESRFAWFIWFADGHSERRRWSTLTPGIFERDYGEWSPVLTTAQGLRGRDY